VIAQTLILNILESRLIAAFFKRILFKQPGNGVYNTCLLCEKFAIFFINKQK